MGIVTAVTPGEMPSALPLAPPARQVPIPQGTTLEKDRATRVLEGGGALLGGNPTRLLRLSRPAAGLVGEWLSGRPVADRRGGQLLARRLVWLGLFHATGPGATMTADDVTVVIPVRGDPEMLADLLGALDGLQVVVVDDGPRESGAIATVARGATVVRGPGRGAGGARNAGLEHVRTPLVAFVDADCVVHPGWLGPLLGHFDDPLIGAAAPRIIAADPADSGWIGRYEQQRPALDRGDRPALVRPRTPVPFVPTAALVVRRELATGACFDESLPRGEDVDFVWRLADAGWAVRYDPSVTVGHHARTDVASWVRQRAGYGSSAGPLARRHPGNLAPASIPALPTAAVALLAARRPVMAAVVAGAGTALVARRLQGRLRHPVAEAVRLVGTGTASSIVTNTAGLARAWGPALATAALAAPKRSTRLTAAAALALPALVDWTRLHTRDSVTRYVLTHVADDVVYGCGVLAGCVRVRDLSPLVPEIVLGRRTWPAPSRADGIQSHAAGATGVAAHR